MTSPEAQGREIFLTQQYERDIAAIEELLQEIAPIGAENDQPVQGQDPEVRQALMSLRSEYAAYAARGTARTYEGDTSDPEYDAELDDAYAYKLSDGRWILDNGEDGYRVVEEDNLPNA